MKANSPWVFLPLVGFVLLAVLLASGLGRDPQELPSALVGKPVPSLVPHLLYRTSFLAGTGRPGRCHCRVELQGRE